MTPMTRKRLENFAADAAAAILLGLLIAGTYWLLGGWALCGWVALLWVRTVSWQNRHTEMHIRQVLSAPETEPLPDVPK